MKLPRARRVPCMPLSTSHKHKLLPTLQRTFLTFSCKWPRWDPAVSISGEWATNSYNIKAVSQVLWTKQLFLTSKRMNTKPTITAGKTTTFKMNSQSTESVARCLVELSEQWWGWSVHKICHSSFIFSPSRHVALWQPNAIYGGLVKASGK